MAVTLIKTKNQNVFNDIFKDGILNKYNVERVDVQKYWEVYYSEFQNHYPAELTFIREGLLTEAEKTKRADLEAITNDSILSNNIIVKDGEKIIAIFRSEQCDTDVYYLRHGVVHPDYRNEGIMSDCLKKGIEYCKQMGFVEMKCCSVVSNNPIIIEMLKNHFSIRAIENHPEYGSIVWLHYYLNEEIKNAMLFNTGMVKFSKKLFQNSEGNAQKLLSEISKASE